MTAWLRLFRPLNALIAAGGVWLGWASMSLRPDIRVAIWGCVSMALLTLAGNADNDICDLKIDRINRPDRPLPSGLLEILRVRIVSILLYVAGVLAALVVTPIHGMLVLGMVILLLAYNRLFKGLPLLGNLTVALLCGLAIYFPEFPMPIQDTLPAVIFAFLATLAREIVKDAEDLEGDRAAGLRTFPIIAGPNAARKLAFSLVAILLAFLPMPVAFFGYRWPYLVLATALAAPFLIALLLELLKSDADYRRCQRYLKWMMIGGMIALLIANL